MTSKILIFRNQKISLVLSNQLPDALPLKKVILSEQVNGQFALKFAVPSKHPDTQQILFGDWAAIKDLDGNYRAFVIVEENENSDEGMIEFFCEELAVTELNDEIVTDVRPTNTNARDALNRILANTLWAAGTVDNLGNGSTNVYYESVMSGIKKIIEVWGGEVRFRVSIGSDNKISGRYVDLVRQLGRKTGKRYEVGKDILSFNRTGDIKTLKTAMYGRGKGEETDSGGYGRRITFKDVEWKKSNGDPIDKPKGQEWVGDFDALAQWGNVNPDGTRRHRMGVYLNEEQTNPAKLLRETWDYLQSIKKPQINFEINVLDLEQVSAQEFRHETVRLGDTVNVIIRDENRNRNIEVEARVVEIERDFLEPWNTQVIIGNVQYGVTDLVRDLEQKIEKKVGLDDPIGWLRGVIDATRSEFHSLNGYVYITDTDGILITNRPKDSPNPPDKAIQLRGGALAIAPSRNSDGSFNWQTFITGDQVIADRINSGRIRTDDVTIGDDSGMVRISGGNVIIKGGGLEVYSTPTGTDNGIMIKGNRISTNFVKNPEFLTQPNETTDWMLNPGVKYDATGKKITIDCSSTMTFIGINQWFDVYHPKATFQALFKTNSIGGSTPKSVRVVIYNFDSNGNQLASSIKTETFSVYQEKLLLTMPVIFPAGTVRCRLWVQVEFDYNLANAMEIHWVRGSYDDLVTQDQLKMYPKDVYNLDSNPEVQLFSVTINVGINLQGNTIYNIGRVNFDKAFSPFYGTGRIICLLQPYSSHSNAYQAVSYGVDHSGFTLSITTNRAISSGSVLTVHGFAYRVDYYASITKSI